MARHLLVLLSDLWGLRVALGLVVLLLVATLATIGVRVLLRRAAPLLVPSTWRTTMTIGMALWLIVLAGTLLGPHGAERPFVRWMTPDLVSNILESRRIYRTVRGGATLSPYQGYDRVHLVRKPDVLLFVVESYGKLIADDPKMRPEWATRLRGMQARLEASGWQMASAYSAAPVSGGRSWLAVGSVLTGTTIRYEAVYRQLLGEIDRLPTLVRFLSRQGYETVHLAPSDRSRPGVDVDNHYRYDRYVKLDDLDYRGPRMGWGIVPDQYALWHTEESQLRGVHRALFFSFHMVSSHAAWDPVPVHARDWRSLNTVATSQSEDFRGSEIGERLERYSRQGPREMYMGPLTASLRAGYERSIVYDLGVIEEYLAGRQGDALVIVMGDHQPPLVSPENEDFDVPIHLFSRDPRLLDEFRERGFSSGLVLPARDGSRIQHAGLFSLIVRALARSSPPGEPLPDYFRAGVSLEG